MTYFYMKFYPSGKLCTFVHGKTPQGFDVIFIFYEVTIDYYFDIHISIRKTLLNDIMMP